MLIKFLLIFCFTSGLALAQTEPLCTTSGYTADSLIINLPRDSNSWAQIGVLFTNRVFLRETTNGQQDTDSALYFFELALRHNRTPRLEAYYAVASALRAKHDGLWDKLTGDTKDRVKRIFRDAERLSRDYPNDLGVTFLIANLLQEGDALDDAKKYWKRSWELFARLSEHSNDTSANIQKFFTDEVRGTILLNQGKLIRKLVEEDAVSKYLALERWHMIIRMYPNTLAALNANEQILKL